MSSRSLRNRTIVSFNGEVSTNNSGNSSSRRRSIATNGTNGRNTRRRQNQQNDDENNNNRDDDPTVNENVISNETNLLIDTAVRYILLQPNREKTIAKVDIQKFITEQHTVSKREFTLIMNEVGDFIVLYLIIIMTFLFNHKKRPKNG